MPELHNPRSHSWQGFYTARRAARIGIFHTKQKTAVAGLGVGFLRRVAQKRGVLKGVGTER